MREQEQPVTQTMKATEARAKFRQLLDEVYQRRARVVVEKDGIAVAAVVSMIDLEQLQFLAERRKWAREVLRRSREAFADVPADELQRELDNALREVRQEMAAERDAAKAR
jgi:prevent-host-death family protein